MVALSCRRDACCHHRCPPRLIPPPPPSLPPTTLAQYTPRDLSPEEKTALDDYVNKPDSNYKWFQTNVTIKNEGSTTYILNMTSQRWLTDKDVDRSIWWHYVAVVVPDKLTYTDKAGLYITGDYNTDAPPDGSSEDLLLAEALALTTNAVCAVLFQIPNAPIYFHAEQPPTRRVEDAIIAYTWEHFFQTPSEPEWLLRLPMTKVRLAGLDVWVLGMNAGPGGREPRRRPVCPNLNLQPAP